MASDRRTRCEGRAQGSRAHLLTDMSVNSGSPFRAGLIGKSIQASLTPAMHMIEGQQQGLEYAYELLDLDYLKDDARDLYCLLVQVENAGFGGLNITHPCKQAIIPYIDVLSDEAAALGAVNTVVLRDGQRYGYNTDWWGFAESFRRTLPSADLTAVVQLGAGGAGAATAFAILQLGARKLTIFDKEATRAALLAKTMQQHFPNAVVSAGNDLAAAMSHTGGLIHATPTGMINYPGIPLPAELLRPSLWVAEIVYFPLETELLIEAARRGCSVLHGGGMAVFQAVRAFHLFTGIEPDAERMLRHFAELTGEHQQHHQGLG